MHFLADHVRGGFGRAVTCVAAVCALFVAVLVSPVHAEYTGPRRLKVGIPNFRPLAFKDSERGYTGLYPDLLKPIAKAENWTIEYVEAPWPDLVKKLEDGELDLMTCMAYTPERAERFNYSKEVVTISWGQAFTGIDGDIASILDLDGKRVAIMERDVNGKHFSEFFQRFGVVCQLVRTKSYEEMCQTLKADRADAVVLSNVISADYVQRYKLRPTAIIFNPVRSMFVASKSADPDIIFAIDSIMRQWRKTSDSVLYQAEERWLKTTVQTEQADLEIVFYAAVTVAAAILVLMLWLWTMRKQVDARTRELDVSLEKYRVLFETFPMGITITDEQGDIIEVNQESSRLLGLGSSEQTDRTLYSTEWDVIGLDGLPLGSTEFPAAIALNEQRVVRDGMIGVARPDGDTVWISVTAAPIPLENYGVAVGYFDVTARLKAEEQLRDNQAFLLNVFASIRDGISVVDRDLNVVHVNPTMEQWYGGGGPLVGRKCHEVYQHCDAPCDPCPTLRAFRSGLVESDIVPGVPGSSIEWLELYCYPIRNNENGEITGVIEFVRDITERRKAEADQREREQRHRIVFENSPLGMIVFDNEGTIVDCNDQFVQLMGSTREKVIGFSAAKQTNLGMREAVAQALSGETAVYEDFYRSVTGSRSLYMRAVFNPVFSGATQTGIIATIEDVSERMEAEVKRRKSEQTYRRLVEDLGDRFCLFHLSLEGIVTYASPSVKHFMDISQEEAVGQQWENLLDWAPEYIEGVEKKLAQLVNREMRFVTFEMAYTDSSGQERFIEITDHTRLNDAGDVIGIEGILVDITERKQTERDLRQYRDELEEMVHDRTKELSETVDELKRRTNESETIARLGDLLQACETDEESFSIFTSMCSQIFSCQSGFLGIYDEQVETVRVVAEFGGFVDMDMEFEVGDCWALRRGGVHLVADPEDDPVCPHAHGEQHLSSVCVPVGAMGEYMGLLHLLWDMKDKPSDQCEQETEAIMSLAKRVAELYALSLANIRLRARLRRQSIRDTLTGLYNRRHMEDALRREVARARRRETQVGVILLDVDHFKQFNDLHGHDAGDEVLRILGSYLNDMTRSEDIACRYGGEELLVILPDCDIENAAQRAEELRAGIEKLVVHYGGNALHVTASLGVAAFPDHGNSPAVVVAAADSALYRAKGSGRNRAVIASDQ